METEQVVDTASGKFPQNVHFGNFLSKVFFCKIHIYLPPSPKTGAVRDRKETFRMASAPDHCVCNLKCISHPTNIKSSTTSQNLSETNKTFLKTHKSSQI